MQETLTQQGLEEAGLETSSRLDCENNGDSSISADLFVDHLHDHQVSLCGHPHIGGARHRLDVEE